MLFQYGPMYGIQIAFKDFKLLKGIWASEWVGFEHFIAMVASPRFWQVLRNTVVISVLKLLFGFPAPILFAILLNELINVRLKKSVQTISYLPHFISWVVLAGIVYEVLSPSLGIVNQVIEAAGGRPHNFMADSDWFVGVVVISYVWQTFGWGSIIYLAALAGIDPQLYEAAQIDGAGRLQRTMSITLPSLYPVMVIVFLLRVGNLLEVGFDQIFNLQNPTIYDTGDIIRDLHLPQGADPAGLELCGRRRAVQQHRRPDPAAGGEPVHARCPRVRVLSAPRTRAERLFDAANITVLMFVSAVVLIPFWLLLVDSFSTPESVYLRDFRAQLLPVSWSITAYETVLQKSAIGIAYANTLFRTVIGTLLNTLVTIATAYAISKRRLPLIRTFTFLVVFTLFFNGGLIPRFLLVRSVGLLDSRWALIWPVLVQAYTLLIARNFMFSIPDSLEESAYIDGANELTILWRIILPLSKPIIATVALWGAVMHWERLVRCADLRHGHQQGRAATAAAAGAAGESDHVDDRRRPRDRHRGDRGNREGGADLHQHRTDRDPVPVRPEVFHPRGADRLGEGLSGAVSRRDPVPWRRR